MTERKCFIFTDLEAQGGLERVFDPTDVDYADDAEFVDQLNHARVQVEQMAEQLAAAIDALELKKAD